MECCSSCITVLGQLILNLTSSVVPLNEFLLHPSTTSMHLLCNQPEEVLFIHFMTMLNDAFERELALADEGYESGSKTSNLSTPLRRTSRIHHISSNENISFDPYTLCTMVTSQSNCKPVHCHLSFSSSDYKDKEEEEDFQTVALDDDHWITDPVPDRYLCIHEYSQPHSLYCYPCSYTDSTPSSYQDILDLSDISDFKDVMTTSSDEDIPALDIVIGL